MCIVKLLFILNTKHLCIPHCHQIGATSLGKRLEEEWLPKLWGIEGKKPSESKSGVGSLLAGLQPEVAEVLVKVEKAVNEESFPDQRDLLNNLLKPLQGMKEAINNLFNSIDKANNQKMDKEREVEMVVAHIQVGMRCGRNSFFSQTCRSFSV